jgi:HSP20 family protein
MSIVTFNPLSELTGLQREMNRLFDDIFPARGGSSDSEGAVWRPSVDVHEDASGFMIDVELAGISKENVRINFQEGTLSISGERKYANECTEKNAHRVERFYGKFHRSVSIPGTVDGDRITASFSDGILHVVVPKAEAVKPRQIEIN